MKNLLEENREEFIMDKQARMKELVEVLNQASKAYYQEDRELFSRKEGLLFHQASLLMLLDSLSYQERASGFRVSLFPAH